MKLNVTNELALLSTDFETALTSHLEKFCNDGNTYGYAILLGEDIDSCDAIAVTSLETDVANVADPDFINDFRYLPDEWQHWHPNAFDDFNRKLNDVYLLFRERCPKDPENFTFSESEKVYLGNVYKMYLDTALNCLQRGAFGDIWYRVIWISDSDYSIIADSFHQLNSGRVIEEAGEYFE